MPTIVGARKSLLRHRAGENFAAPRSRWPSAVFGHRLAISGRGRLAWPRNRVGPSIGDNRPMATAEPALSVPGFGPTQMHRLLFISIQSRRFGLYSVTMAVPLRSNFRMASTLMFLVVSSVYPNSSSNICTRPRGSRL
jgi:hypothetical protein